MATLDTAAESVLSALPSDTERFRYSNLLNELAAVTPLLRGQGVLDFGASWGTSAIALLHTGAADVIGVEPDAKRVEQGRALITDLGLDDHITIAHAADTGSLPFPDGAFSFVLANGVFEHIPRPRTRYLAEVWRVLADGGHLFIAETPNPYWPRDIHTTGLWFNHWLPERLAHRRAVWAGRFRAERTDWASSGWRGMSYYEMVGALPDAQLMTAPTRRRHRLLAAVGLPSQLLDPGPVWLLRKGG